EFRSSAIRQFCSSAIRLVLLKSPPIERGCSMDSAAASSSVPVSVSKPRNQAAVSALTAATAAALIDHTLVRADATRDELASLCAEALQYRFASVCVNACYVS